MEFYSAVKKNVIMLFAGKWMELREYHVKRQEPSAKS
jgi:hypothetical protein